MSHFTVLVIGPDPESQLIPFQENNMGDCPEGFLQFHEDEDGNIDPKTGKRGWWENPNAKWDWYSLGGRWAGFFRTKPGILGNQGHHRAKDFARITGEVVEDLAPEVCDQCLKGEIDIQTMRNEAANEAAKMYDGAMALIDGLPECEPWASIGKRLDYSQEARRLYHDQSRVKAFEKRDMDVYGYHAKVEDYQMPRERHIQNAMDSVIQTHAILKDGKWYEKGRMGWWAVVHDEKDEALWNQEFTKLFDSLPDDTLLSVYDCHI